MLKPTSDLKAIMKTGGSVSVSSTISTADLKAIAKAGIDSGAVLIVRNAGEKPTSDLKAIAKKNPGHVTFEFE